MNFPKIGRNAHFESSNFKPRQYSQPGPRGIRTHQIQIVLTLGLVIEVLKKILENAKNDLENLCNVPAFPALSASQDAWYFNFQECVVKWGIDRPSSFLYAYFVPFSVSTSRLCCKNYRDSGMGKCALNRFCMFIVPGAMMLCPERIMCSRQLSHIV